MKNGSGFVLVFVGVLLLWMAITGRLDCLSSFVKCVVGGAGTSTAATGASAGGFSLPALPTVPSVGGILNK